MLSEKRASSPVSSASLTNGDAPLPSKARRLNGTQPPRVRKPAEMGGVWTMYIDNLLDSEDFGEALLGLESLISRLHIPTKTHIRQLLALAISPSACSHAVRKTNDGRRAEPKLKPPTVDPFPSTKRKVRLLALRLLEDIAATLGADAVFRALRGYGVDESLQEEDNLAEENSDGEDGPEDDDNPLNLAGKRVGQCEEVWAMLGGGAARDAKAPVDGEPMSEGAWEILRSFVGMWEGEAKKRAEAEELGVSPSLLHFLPANISGVRELPKMGKGPMPIISWPFRAEETTDASEEDDENEEDEEDHEADKKAKQRKKRVDDDEMPLAEKQAVSMRLLGLLAQAVSAGRLDASSLLFDTSMSMKGLSSESFATFVERLPLSTPHFTVRLCTYYLETYSLAAQSPPNASPNASPSRRRALGANGSVSSVGTTVHPRATLPTSREILSLLAKLPSIFPLPPDSASSTPSLAPLNQHRAPKRDPPTFAKVAEACEAHLLLKHALLEGIWGTLDSEEGRQIEKAKLEEMLLVDGEAGRVLGEVEQKIEEARKRVEGAKEP